MHNFQVRVPRRRICWILLTYPPDMRRPSDTLIEIPNRDPQLPQLYLLKTHAKVKRAWKAKHIFVYLQDTDPAAMEEYYKFVSAMPFPEGTNHGIRKAGEYNATSVHSRL